jgi:hypothetical protein
MFAYCYGWNLKEIRSLSLSDFSMHSKIIELLFVHKMKSMNG